MSGELKEKLYQRAVQNAADWFALEPEKAFEVVFSSDADFDDEKQVADRYYAVLRAVVDQLEEDGVVKGGELETFVYPSLTDATHAVILHNPTNREFYHLADKFWHRWDSPEELKEELLEAYWAVVEGVRGTYPLYALQLEEEEKCPNCNWGTTVLYFRARDREEALKVVEEVRKALKEEGGVGKVLAEHGFLCASCSIEPEDAFKVEE